MLSSAQTSRGYVLGVFLCWQVSKPQGSNGPWNALFPCDRFEVRALGELNLDDCELRSNKNVSNPLSTSLLREAGVPGNRKGTSITRQYKMTLCPSGFLCSPSSVLVTLYSNYFFLRSQLASSAYRASNGCLVAEPPG